MPDRQVAREFVEPCQLDASRHDIVTISGCYLYPEKLLVLHYETTHVAGANLASEAAGIITFFDDVRDAIVAWIKWRKQPTGTRCADGQYRSRHCQNYSLYDTHNDYGNRILYE